MTSSHRPALVIILVAIRGAAAFAAPSAAAPQHVAPPKTAIAAKSELSFCQPPFVHPRIIQDLLAWESDGGDQVVAINLTDSQGSNRYYGEIKVQPSEAAQKHPQVSTTVRSGQGSEQQEDTIVYQYVGTTSSGVHVLTTWQWGSGTMVSRRLLLVTIEEDPGIDQSPAAQGGGIGNRNGALRFNRPRLLIRKLGELVLGDRWEGALRVEGNKILVGHDEGFLSRREAGENFSPYNSQNVVLDLEDSAARPGILKPCP